MMRSASLDSPELFYDRYANEFDTRMNRYEVEKRIHLVFSDVLRHADLADCDFLDAGCGTGLFSRIAVERGANVTSLDVGERLLSRVAEKCGSRRVVGDVQRLPFPDASYDVVLATEVIEHVRQPPRAVAELARVLRPGGTLILTTPNRRWHWLVVFANRLKVRPYEELENWARWGEFTPMSRGRRHSHRALSRLQCLAIRTSSHLRRY